ncbi:hypothetical protein [Flectobacillus roseus]|uniref:DNA-binding protein n=1 Tax=Flectobacillus roseus TaxID=502259 RepID=A0ABT6Y723_9BACT|nr:hypothetical protein [Flectobacillus roseus]MDI9859321.1 hypothetical protein [Flectobacillus roseus]
MPRTSRTKVHLSDDTIYILKEFEKKISHLESIITAQTKQPSSIPEVLQPSEVCTKMGWSRSKFEQFKREGLFRTFKIGGKVYVYTSDILALFPEGFFH